MQKNTRSYTPNDQATINSIHSNFNNQHNNASSSSSRWDDIAIMTIQTLIFGFSSGLGYAIARWYFHSIRDERIIRNRGLVEEHENSIGNAADDNDTEEYSNQEDFKHATKKLQSLATNVNKAIQIYSKELSCYSIQLIYTLNNYLQNIPRRKWHVIDYIYGLCSIPILVHLLHDTSDDNGGDIHAIIPLYLTWFLRGDTNNITIHNRDNANKDTSNDYQDDTTNDLIMIEDTPHPQHHTTHFHPKIQEVSQVIEEKRHRSDSNLSDFTNTSILGGGINNSSSSSGGGGPVNETINTTNNSTSSGSTTQYLEMLVHNVSHLDMVLSLRTSDSCRDSVGDSSTATYANSRQLQNKTNQMDTISPSSACTSSKKEKEEQRQNLTLCRPRFSAFDSFCRRILSLLEQFKNDNIVIAKNENDANVSNSIDNTEFLLKSILSFPRYERPDTTARCALVTPRSCQNLPVGFDLSRIESERKRRCSQGMDGADKGEENVEDSLDLSEEDLQHLRVRGRDMSKVKSMEDESPIMPEESSTMHHLDSTDDISKEWVTAANSETTACTIKPLHLDGVFFPLLSSLMRTFESQIAEKYGSTYHLKQKKKLVKKVVILVSGVGTPRNWTHSIDGNSTQACAELMEMFIKVLYPEVSVVRLHSRREIFRYDENIRFAKKELMPCIDAFRDAHARSEKYPDEVTNNDLSLSPGDVVSKKRRPFNPDWKDTFSVTLSFADGASARTYAIQTAMRAYRPTYFHFWQLKTFWHDTKICDDDIEVHSFEHMSVTPAMEIEKVNENIQMVVKDMKQFRIDFLSVLQQGQNDIRQFWLRKTQKPVLAVLLVEHPQKGLTLYRGTNMEVSMPTGSLCAERNVIGTALATNPGLRREDIKMVAVLALPLPKEQKEESVFSTPVLVASPPPGYVDTTKEASVSDRKEPETLLTEVEEKLAHYQRETRMRRSMSVGSFASIIEYDNSDHENFTQIHSTDQQKHTCGQQDNSGQPRFLHATRKPLPNSSSNSDYVVIPPESSSMPPPETSVPVRKIKLLNDDEQPDILKQRKSGILRKAKKRAVLVHSSADMNPLMPCGACNEWLKKISESNPSFRVLTFTDADCSGIYCSPCQE